MRTILAVLFTYFGVFPALAQAPTPARSPASAQAPAIAQSPTQSPSAASASTSEKSPVTVQSPAPANTPVGVQFPVRPNAAAAVQAPAQANAPAPAEPARVTKPRLTMQQRFARANTTGDGRLTLEQAKAGYPTIARRFREIDLEGRGYVTIEDIRAWYKVRREMREQAKTAVDEALRPRAAYQRMLSEPSRAVAQPVGTVPHAPAVQVSPAAEPSASSLGESAERADHAAPEPSSSP
ncbi:MAG: hypothetical protein AB7F35_27190 [Acetobacteraceae bacterium]